MIEQADRRLADWIATVLDGQQVTFAPPVEEAVGAGISLYLMDLRNDPPARGGTPAPWQIVLRYLVTAWAVEPTEAHRLLGELVFAAIETPDLEVELDPLPVDLWAAFGVAPRPAFVLRVPLRRERPERAVRRVRLPPIFEIEPTRRLDGTVLGPGDFPLAGARVELPALGRSARTDPRGRFAFPAVPAGGTRELRVRAKGHQLTVDAVPGDEPLTIRFPTMED